MCEIVLYLGRIKLCQYCVVVLFDLTWKGRSSMSCCLWTIQRHLKVMSFVSLNDVSQKTKQKNKQLRFQTSQLN